MVRPVILTLMAGLLAPISASAAEPRGFIDSVETLIGREVDPHEMTLALRDLIRTLPNLSPAGRLRASRILARPTDGASDPEGYGYAGPGEFSCAVNVCVHWPDDLVEPIPQTVEDTLAALEEVWAFEVDTLGYRPPLTDDTSVNAGPDGRIDVYLADTGADSIYGYCTSDDPNALLPTEPPRYDVSAYCVLDDDFAIEQFGAPPSDSRNVTAAHEFFHAIQFGYDFGEDSWFMESTAAWIEDEAYDEVNDNLQYLGESPLAKPGVPLDLGRSGHEYGSWIFFR